MRNSRVRREEREKSQLLGNQRNLSIQKEKKKFHLFFFLSVQLRSHRQWRIPKNARRAFVRVKTDWYTVRSKKVCSSG